MRTWKQGRVGRIRFQDSTYFYVKCLKYPLARIYASYEERTGSLDEFLYEINVDLSVLKKIETIAQQKISKEERARIRDDIKLYDVQDIEALLIRCGELKK